MPNYKQNEIITSANINVFKLLFGDILCTNCNDLSRGCLNVKYNVL